MIKINKDLKALRIELDNINTSIASLISQRIEVVKEVSHAKKETKNFYVAERENFIFKTLSKKFPEIDKNILKSIFTEIISGCRSYEKVFTVGLLEDVYSLAALTKILGSFTNNFYFKNIGSLENEFNLMDYVLLPLNNNFTTFVRNIQDIFVINYYKDGDNIYFLIGKTENEITPCGKISYLMKKIDLVNIEDEINKFSWKKLELGENIFIEFNYSSIEEIKKIENIFLEKGKYLGTYPNNEF